MNIDFEKFKELSQRFNLIPVYEVLPADLETPVSAFLKLKSDEYDFLFESVTGGEKWGRYSFLGTRPKAVYTLRQNVLQVYHVDSQSFENLSFTHTPLEVFRDVLEDVRAYEDPGLPRFFGGLVGYFSYDMVRYFDKIQLTNIREMDLPELCLLLTETVVIFDNLAQAMKVVVAVEIPESCKGQTQALQALYDKAQSQIFEIKTKLQAAHALPLLETHENHASIAMQEHLSREEYCDMVEVAKDYIEAGDIFQVVLSNRFELDAHGVDAFAVYRVLRRLNPSPYMFYLKIKDLKIVGASPEILVRLEDEKITVRPIAGTRHRGATDEEDKSLEQELLNDPKELAEHIMLVDLGRNDVGRVSKVGSVCVEEENVIERYSHVMHLVSHVTGELSPDKDVFDVIAATFPAGTLSGAPKIRAMEIIEELENVSRGLYGGAIGYVSFTQNADLAIAIRTAVLNDDRAVVQAGAGIVYNSVPENEYQECVNKATAVIRAIQMVKTV